MLSTTTWPINFKSTHYFALLQEGGDSQITWLPLVVVEIDQRFLVFLLCITQALEGTDDASCLATTLSWDCRWVLSSAGEALELWTVTVLNEDRRITLSSAVEAIGALEQFPAWLWNQVQTADGDCLLKASTGALTGINIEENRFIWTNWFTWTFGPWKNC